MKKVSGKMAVTAILFAAVFILSSLHQSYSLESEMARTTQDITLQKANSARDPYSLIFNVKVTAPGTIAAHLRKPEGSFRLGGKERLFRLVIADARAYREGSRSLDKKYIRKAMDFGHERGLIEYSVDSIELQGSKGEFIVLVANFYDKRPYEAHLQIMYPVVKASGHTLKPVEMKLRPLEVRGISSDEQ